MEKNENCEEGLVLIYQTVGEESQTPWPTGTARERGDHGESANSDQDRKVNQ